MLKEIWVMNPKGDILEMPLADPAESGMIIKDVKGIGPGDAVINMTEISTNDGSIYNSARLTDRDINLTIEFYPEKYSIETIRHRTYSYFPLKGYVSLLFVTDTRLVMASGYVEKNEPVIFTQNEYTSITIRCPDPYFYSAEDEGETSFSSVVSQFEFPFSNESLEDNLISMGEIVQDTDQYIEYQGDGETGITIEIDAYGSVGNIEIYNVDTHESMSIAVNKIPNGFGSGDKIIITTVTGHKSVRLLRSGAYINILNALDRDCDWLKLNYGVNHYAYSVASGGEHVNFTITYRTLYEGV